MQHDLPMTRPPIPVSLQESETAPRAAARGGKGPDPRPRCPGGQTSADAVDGDGEGL